MGGKKEKQKSADRPTQFFEVHETPNTTFFFAFLLVSNIDL